MVIDYTKYDQEDVKTELINYLTKTETFKDAKFQGSNLNYLVNALSYNATLFGYYLNRIANEVYLDSTQIYKNANRISHNLLYNPIGTGSSLVSVASKLSKEYVLGNNEGYIEIPSYSLFPSTKGTPKGVDFSFTNESPMVVQVQQFGVHFIKQMDIKYTGQVSGTVLSANGIVITATKKNPVHVLDIDGNYLGESVVPITSSAHGTLPSFLTDTLYSLILNQNGDGSFALLIYPETTSTLPNEIMKFKVNEYRGVEIVRNYCTNRVYRGRLGVRNMEYVTFYGVPFVGKINQMSKLQMIIPQYSPTFEILINGDTYSFSSLTEDIIIETDDLPDGTFTENTNMNVVFTVTDLRETYYGAKLLLKKDADLLPTDVVIAILPVNSDTFINGNLKIEQNAYAQGASKSGVVEFLEGELSKRVIFEEPYDFGNTLNVIPFDSTKDYSIFTYANTNVETFYTDKKTTGFIINVEPEAGFTGKVYWSATAYEKTAVQDELVDLKLFSQQFDPTAGYAVILQPGANILCWTSNQGDDEFKVNSDRAFVGEVDYLLLPSSQFETGWDFEESGTTYVSKNETSIEITFSKPQPNATYRIFLKPDSNVRVWWENKTTTGFTIRVEPETDFYGKVDWNLHTGPLSNTLQMGGSNLVSGEPLMTFTDVPETLKLGSIVQGLAHMSIVDKNGLISTTTNGLNLVYNTDTTVNPGLSFTVNNSTISYHNLRVFVKIGDSWVEFTNIDDYNGEVTAESQVFHSRVNKDQKINVVFGNNDKRGFDPSGNQVIIIGLECVGVDGNIGTNVLSNQVLISLNFNTNDINTAEVESAFVDLLGIKQDLFFQGVTQSTMLDWNNQEVTSTDLSIVQLEAGMFGTNPEDVEGIRKNAQISHQAQDRTVTSSDYKSILASNFSEFVIDLEVFNFKEALALGLISDAEKAKAHANTVYFMMIPKYGTTFTLIQREYIKAFIESKARKHLTVDSVILEPVFVPIDVLALYSNKAGTSPTEARNAIIAGVRSFFDRSKRKLGDSITVEAVRNSIDQKTINSLSLQMYRDDKNQNTPSDYDVDITPDQYQDPFADVQKQKLQDAIRTELRNLISKGIIQISQPLFDVQEPNGTRDWIYSGDINLGRFEFPLLGEIVIERKT